MKAVGYGDIYTASFPADVSYRHKAITVKTAVTICYND